MERTYVKPPKTLLEVFENLPEGTPAQLINNQLIMLPAPTPAHQLVLGEIHAQSHFFVKEKKLGTVIMAPCDVYLNRKNAYEPDLIFLANESLHKIKDNGLYGAPDLVIEVLSPATWHYDKGDKKDEYERSGVKEYWLVDPKDKTTEGFQLVNEEYKPLPSKEGKITFRLFDYTLTF
jgi:Uma2 family endonuclease